MHESGIRIDRRVENDQKHTIRINICFPNKKMFSILCNIFVNLRHLECFEVWSEKNNANINLKRGL